MSLSKRLGQTDSEHAKSFPDLSKFTEDAAPSVDIGETVDVSLKSQVLEKLLQTMGQLLYM
ncbi:MAG: hypothetical protein ACKN9F_00065 [Methylomonas sp.]